MAVNKILQVLIIDEFGGGEWFDVQWIDVNKVDTKREDT